MGAAISAAATHPFCPCFAASWPMASAARFLSISWSHGCARSLSLSRRPCIYLICTLPAVFARVRVRVQWRGIPSPSMTHGASRATQTDGALDDCFCSR
jgi:hypothetical protein